MLAISEARQCEIWSKRNAPFHTHGAARGHDSISRDGRPRDAVDASVLGQRRDCTGGWAAQRG